MLNYKCHISAKSPIQREVMITINPESIQEYINQQLDAFQKKAKINGFRPGKVPLHIIKKQYMEEAKAEAFSNLVRDSYLQALEENKIEPIGQPKIETKSGVHLNEGESLVYTAQIEIFPEIKTEDLTKLQVKKPSEDLSQEFIDKEVERTLDRLQKNHAQIIPWVDHTEPVKTDDIIQISYTGTLDGKALEGLKEENRLLKIGSHQYIKDFEDAFIGMKKEETKTFTVTFPKEYYDKKVAGKNIEFTATVHEFKKEQLPEINDDFAKQFKQETVLELRKELTQTIRVGLERESKNTFKQSILKSLLDTHSFEVPSQFIDSQEQHLNQQMKSDLKNHGFTEKMIEDHLEKQKQEIRKRAEDQVRVTLILDKIAQEQSIKIEETDLDQAYSKMAADENIKFDEVKQFFTKEANARRELRFRLKEERTIEYLKSQIKLVA